MHLLFRFLILISLAFCFIAPVGIAPVRADGHKDKTIKIGIYNNKPFCFINEEGKPDGFAIDIVNSIAKEKGLKVEFVFDVWSNHLKGLNDGSLDILAVIALTKQRARNFDFTQENLFTNWGQLYQQSDGDLQDHFSLAEKTIGHLDGDIYYMGEEGLKNVLSKLGVPVKFKAYKEYRQVFQALSKGEVDAGLVNRLFGQANAPEFGVEKTPTLVSPISIGFAMPKGAKHNAALINDFDASLEKAKKAGANSYYFKAVDKWIAGVPATAINPWIIRGLYIAGGIAVILFVGNLLLGYRVNQRTAELEAAKNAAEEASNAKSQFLTSMSHELRTPLNAIIGFSEILSADFKERQEKDNLDLISRVVHSGKHLSTLIGDILDFSTIESGPIEINVSPINTTVLVAEVTASMRPLAAKNKNNLAFIPPATDTTIHSDGDRLRQVMTNLISNACKYTENGEILVSINQVSSDEIKFEIADTGVGMNPEELNGFFQSFTRGKSLYSHKVAGAGLGLTISHRIAKALGGELTASSTPGEGSIFILSLPKT